jgi:hypothetical protein
MEQLQLKEIVGYLPYGLKCQYEGIINGKEISKHRKEFEQDGDPFCNWEHFEPIEEIKGLKVAPLKTIRKYKNYWVATCGIYNNGQKGFYNGFGIKPILFPISLFKDINSNEMNELNVDLFNQMELCDLANKKIHFQNCNHSTILICLENKIDFQNLIEKGLAIAVTEDFNPYK